MPGHESTVTPQLLVLLLLGLGCNRQVEPADTRRASIDASGEDLRITTKITRTLERFEERQAQAKQAQKRHREETGQRTKYSGIHTVALNAASQRRFAQIWWAARYRHGQTPTARVEIDSSIVQCTVDLSGDPTPGDESDWTDFETRIDGLPSGRYRIIAPLREVTLDVP
jgi:hypothetical protein